LHCSAAIDHFKKATPADYKSVLASNKPFEDKDFPHDHRSIHPEEKSDDIKWERARKLLPHASTFGSKNKPWDITQGAIGDCYFMAAVGALAEIDPERIKKIFVPEVWSYPQEGIFAAQVFVRGKPTVVTIDDYLPTKVYGKTMKLVYAQPSADGGIWGALLEKVWAKTLGYYKRIEGGLSA